MIVLIAVLLVLGLAWEAEGWYLLVPPRSEYKEISELLQGYAILADKPLPPWGQQGAYDSAAECEGACRQATDPLACLRNSLGTVPIAEVSAMPASELEGAK